MNKFYLLCELATMIISFLQLLFFTLKWYYNQGEIDLLIVIIIEFLCTTIHVLYSTYTDSLMYFHITKQINWLRYTEWLLTLPLILKHLYSLIDLTISSKERKRNDNNYIISFMLLQTMIWFGIYSTFFQELSILYWCFCLISWFSYIILYRETYVLFTTYIVSNVVDDKNTSIKHNPVNVMHMTTDISERKYQEPFDSPRSSNRQLSNILQKFDVSKINNNIENDHTMSISQRNALQSIFYLYFISWLLFPILFMIGPESFNLIDMEASNALHAIGDIFAKNLFGYLAWKFHWVDMNHTDTSFDLIDNESVYNLSSDEIIITDNKLIFSKNINNSILINNINDIYKQNINKNTKINFQLNNQFGIEKHIDVLSLMYTYSTFKIIDETELDEITIMDKQDILDPTIIRDLLLIDTVLDKLIIRQKYFMKNNYTKAFSRDEDGEPRKYSKKV